MTPTTIIQMTEGSRAGTVTDLTMIHRAGMTMNPTTDGRPPRPSPARRSKIAASVLSAGAMFAIVTGLATTAHDGQATSGTSAGEGGGFPTAGMIRPAEPTAAVVSPPSVPTVIPSPAPAVAPSTARAPAPAQTTYPVPDGVSRGSGG